MTINSTTRQHADSEISSVNLRLTAIIVLASFLPLVMMTAPAFTAQFSRQLELNPAQIGSLFMAELGAMSLATLPALFWIKRVNLRTAAVVSSLIFLTGNLLSATEPGYSYLLPLRFFTALGGGSLMIICMSTAATLPNPAKAYGLWVLGQLLVGAIGIQVLPGLFDRFGLAVGYLLMASLMVATLTLTKAFPRALSPVHTTTQSLAHKGSVILGLLAVFVFDLSISGVWTFIGSIAAASDISIQSSSSILAVATLMGVAGAGVASLTGSRPSRMPMTVAGYVALVTSVLLLLDKPDLLRFAFAALAFKFTWTFVLPLVMACIADLDPSGRLMNITNLVVGGGLALGPALAGQLIQSQGSYTLTLLGSAALCSVSLALVLLSRASRSVST